MPSSKKRKSNGTPVWARRSLYAETLGKTHLFLRVAGARIDNNLVEPFDYRDAEAKPIGVDALKLPLDTDTLGHVRCRVIECVLPGRKGSSATRRERHLKTLEKSLCKRNSLWTATHSARECCRAGCTPVFHESCCGCSGWPLSLRVRRTRQQESQNNRGTPYAFAYHFSSSALAYICDLLTLREAVAPSGAKTQTGTG